MSTSPSPKEMEPPKATSSVPHWRLVFSQGLVTPEVEAHDYSGAGTAKDPFLVEFLDNDPRDPMNWPDSKKWAITLTVAVATLAVAFVSSAYTGSTKQIIAEFGCSQEVAVLGVSLFVLGFAIGPLLWAPLSELYGRQVLFFGTYAVLTAFNAGAAGATSMAMLIVFRFFAGAFGASPLTNAGGVIADMFPASQRGLGMSIFAAAPFLGPVIGPIVGGFTGESVGWRWVEGVMAIFTGVLWIAGALFVPETYSPVILRKRAKELSKRTGHVYISILEHQQGKTTVKDAFAKALARPWQLLFLEPIVLLISIYMAILYGTLYMLFGAFPIVYQQNRGWSQGIGGLAFLGVAVGMIIGVGYSIIDNKRYERVEREHGGEAPPEARLPPGMAGAIALPIGVSPTLPCYTCTHTDFCFQMFWFAWTNYPSIHWIVSIIATAPFGFGMVLVFLSCMNYLIDSYTVYAASVLAANSVLRSLFGAAFPLFTSQMYGRLGIHWASTIPAFLALICLPFPFLFYKFGERIRMKCKYAAQAHQIMEGMKKKQDSEGAGDGEAYDETNNQEKVAESVTPAAEGNDEGMMQTNRTRSLSTTSTLDDVESTRGRQNRPVMTRTRSAASRSRHAHMVRTYTQGSHHHF